jgi:hypothetical protein
MTCADKTIIYLEKFNGRDKLVGVRLLLMPIADRFADTSACTHARLKLTLNSFSTIASLCISCRSWNVFRMGSFADSAM